MALTEIQRQLCQTLARRRIQDGESYVAGGAALNEWIRAPRLSRDIDLFHDTEAALAAAWLADRTVLEKEGWSVQLLRERPSFVEASVSDERGAVIVQWTRDSAYRFFPLVTHQDLGLTLHPFDLATNKVLALVGRLEPRDWIDTIETHLRLQPLGYMAWAACGKDPGFGPASILAEARRSGRYSAPEISSLEFASPPPDPRELSVQWRQALEQADEIVNLLPAESAGACVLSSNGDLFRKGPENIETALGDGEIVFHAGSIGGAFPEIRAAGVSPGDRSKVVKKT